MENEDRKNQVQNELNPELFTLVNNQKENIHDEKFKTKPTTFAKDAFKRFCKNKSSVVGAIIIGVLLLGSFLSFLSPHDIRSSHTDQALLLPKLFETGTGFWDGTKKYSKIAYDDATGGPANFVAEHCYNLSFDSGDDVQYIDQYYRYAAGGYLRVASTRALSKKSNKPEKYPITLYNYTSFDLKKTDNLEVVIDFGNVDNVAEASKLCPSYKVSIVDTKGTYSRLDQQEADDEEYEIFSGTKEDYVTKTFNLSKAIEDLGIDEIEHARIKVSGFAENQVEDTYYYLIKTISFKTTSTDEAYLKELEDISVSNANHTAGLVAQPDGSLPKGTWISTFGDTPYSVITIYHAEMRTVSFTYDVYGSKLGLRKGFVVGGDIIDKYIAKGWCSFTDLNDVSTFKVLNEDKCPIVSLYEGAYSEEYKVYSFTCDVVYYKYLGYSAMPKYLFGTDAQGHDLLTVALSSLKNSLLVAIIASAICLVIGLIWGSISGYFGGTVDLLMERFTDILGGVPWIVMMTLIILHLGNNIVTFAFALVMTGWISTASRTRTQFYRFRGREYVLASRTLGANDARLIFRHILPNGLGTIVTGSVLMIPGCIFSEASISYLGLGLQGVDSFGVLLSDNQKYLSSYPLLIIVPAIIISLLMISFNLFGNGLRDALNPTLKGGEQ